MVAAIEDLAKIGKDAQVALGVIEQDILQARNRLKTVQEIISPSAPNYISEIEKAEAALSEAQQRYAENAEKLVAQVNPDLFPEHLPSEDSNLVFTRLSSIGLQGGSRLKIKETPEQREEMLQNARETHDVLSKMSVDQRTSLMEKFNAEVMPHLAPVLSTMISVAVGKSQSAADGEMSKAGQWFDYLLADEQKNVVKDIRTHGIKEGFHIRDVEGKAITSIEQLSGKLNVTQYGASKIVEASLPEEGQEAKGNGICFSQPPKNYPFALGVGDPLLAMFAGNATIMKVPADMQDIMDTFAQYWNQFIGEYAEKNKAELGLDDDDVEVLQRGAAMQVVTSYGWEKEANNVRVVSSTEVGRKVHKSYVLQKTELVLHLRDQVAEAWHLCEENSPESQALIEQTEAYEADAKRFIAELAGANVMYIGPDLNDAELDMAAQKWLDRVIDNNGMICTKIEDGMVHQDIADKFWAKVEEKWKKFDEGTIGRVHVAKGTHGVHTDPKALQTALAFIEDAKKAGAQVIGGKLSADGLSMTPAMIKWVNAEGYDIKDTHLLERAKNLENFAPITNFMTVESVDEAIEITNKSKINLTCSLWTKDPEAIGEYMVGTKLGSYNIFNPKHGSDNAPFGEHMGLYHHVKYVVNEQTGEVELHIEDNGATGGHSHILQQLNIRGVQNPKKVMFLDGDNFAQNNGGDTKLAAKFNVKTIVKAGVDLARDTDLSKQDIITFARDVGVNPYMIAPSLQAA